MRAIGLLLSDARLPAGGHAHSGGVEQACDEGIIADMAGLADFVAGRLETAGVVAAWVAAAVCRRASVGDPGPAWWNRVDAEVNARLASPAARAVSRQQGAHLLRTATQVLNSLPLALVDGPAPHHSVVLGAVAAAAGLEPEDAARLAAYASVAGPASAAVRLLGLDPAGVAQLTAGLADRMDDLAAAAGAGSGRPLSRLPAPSAPATDGLGEEHFKRKGRLFVS